MRNLPKILLFALLIACTAATCDKDDDNLQTTPECIKVLIQQMKSEPVSNPPGSVWQYEYNGEIVFFIPQKCCDFPSRLIDADCNIICSPDGGFSGSGDGKCGDFFSKRKNEKLIWRDERK